MKKMIARFALALTVIVMAVGAASCDKVEELLNYLMGGETYTYEGTYSMELFKDDPTQDNTVIPAGDPVVYSGIHVQLITTGTGGNIMSIKLVVPGSEFMKDVTMTDVTLTNLALSNGVLDLSENSRATGSLTVDGTEYAIATASLEAKATNEVLVIDSLVIYFGENQEYAVRIKYPDGKCVSTTRAAED